MEYAVHEIPPVWDYNSKILILGSFPSVLFLQSSTKSFLESNGSGRELFSSSGNRRKEKDAPGASCGCLGCDRLLSDRRLQ